MERTAFGTVIGLWAAGLGAAAQFGKVAVTFDDLSGIYGAAGPVLGFAVSLVGFVGILFGVTAGLIVARVGARRALIAALLLGALLSAYQATLPALPLFLFSRAIEGASHLAIVVAAPTLIAQLSLPRHRGLTLSLWSTFFGVAFALLVWLGLPLVRASGVGALFAAHGGYMAAMAILIAFLLPRDVVGPGQGRLNLPDVVQDHIRIYRSPWLSAPALGWFCYAASFVAILTIMPQFLPDAARDAVVGAMPLAGIASSMTLGVWFLRRLPAIAVVQAGFLCCLLAAVTLWALPQHPAPYIALALAMGLVQGSSFAAIPQLNATPQGQAQANGALAQMGNVGTTSGTPMLAAAVGQGGIGGFLLFAALLFSCGFCVHLIMARRRSHVAP
ncbi:MFS transporter [Arenibacterium sp. CAU 1754]